MEIIELKDKPSVPQHSTALDAMGRKPVFEDLGVHHRALAALGEQDVSFSQLRPFDPGVKVLGASSDHLILDVTHAASGYQVGDIVYFSSIQRRLAVHDLRIRRQTIQLLLKITFCQIEDSLHDYS